MFFSSDLTVAIAFSETAEIIHERVNLCLDVRNKRKLERAAACEETTVSRFVLHNAVAVADRLIEARRRNVFAAADSNAFHDAPLHPPERIAGFCMLSAASFGKDSLPTKFAKRLPHYRVLVAVIGRLAVDLRSQVCRRGRCAARQ